jgi:hypothetical protein
VLRVVIKVVSSNLCVENDKWLGVGSYSAVAVARHGAVWQM